MKRNLLLITLAAMSLIASTHTFAADASNELGIYDQRTFTVDIPHSSNDLVFYSYAGREALDDSLHQWGMKSVVLGGLTTASKPHDLYAELEQSNPSPVSYGEKVRSLRAAVWNDHSKRVLLIYQVNAFGNVRGVYVNEQGVAMGKEFSIPGMRIGYSDRVTILPIGLDRYLAVIPGDENEPGAKMMFYCFSSQKVLKRQYLLQKDSLRYSFKNLVNWDSNTSLLLLERATFLGDQRWVYATMTLLVDPSLLSIRQLRNTK